MLTAANFCISMILLSVLSAPALSLVVNIPKPQADSRVAQDYYIQLLRQALAKGAAGREIPELHETSVMEQGRAIRELTRGAMIDVYWMGTSIEREQKLRAIRIPLDRGLIGYRRFIIRADRQREFAVVSNVAELKHLLACQGLDWPDVDIMRSAGLRVTEVAVLEGLYQQVVAKRCDYFPRGYYEAVPELMERTKHYPELTEQKTLILYYPFAVYFFVRPGNEELAQWIEQGLEKMIDEGEFLLYMQNHPLTSHVFPLNKNLANGIILTIPNPLLPSDTNYLNPRYWFQPESFDYSVN